MMMSYKKHLLTFLSSNRLLRHWTRPIPLVKLNGDVNHYLHNVYVRDLDNTELTRLTLIWSEVSSHLEDTAGDINVEVNEWLDLLGKVPSDYFEHNSVFSEEYANILLDCIIAAVSDCGFSNLLFT